MLKPGVTVCLVVVYGQCGEWSGVEARCYCVFGSGVWAMW